MLIDKRIFFDEYRRQLDIDGKLTQTEVNNIDLFLNMTIQRISYFSIAQWAYVFATVFHETAHTFACVKEAFRQSEQWRKLNLYYFPHYGRGYPQITHEVNYKKFDVIIKRDLGITIQSREQYLDPKISFYTLIYGFRYGSFTGKAISDYIPNNTALSERKYEQAISEGIEATETLLFKFYKDARRCWNGTDKDVIIAEYALEFLRILNKSIIK